MIAERRLEALDCASLIAAARTPADTDSSDHLPVNHDGNSARICEEVEESGLSRNAVGIVPELHRADGSGLTRLERRLRLQQRGANVVINLSVHALHMHEFASVIEDIERHRAALRLRPVAACPGDLLCRRERNLIGVKNARCALA